MRSRQQGGHERKMLCLPRKSKPGEWCPRAKDHIPLIPRDEWSEWSDTTLRDKVRQVLDQDGVGSCATESTTQSVMVARAMAGLPFVLLNPWYIYHTTSGGRDRGSSIDENLRFAREHGIASEAVWPRSKGWRKRPSDEAIENAKKYRIEEFYDIQTVDEFVSALLCGFPVVWGAKGHSVLKVEHRSEREGLDVNSWGTDWGDDGFGVWASYRAIQWNYGAFAVRTTTMAGIPDLPPPRTAVPDCEPCFLSSK